MENNNEFESLTKEDIEGLFLRKKSVRGKTQRPKVFCLCGTKARFVTFAHRDIQMLSNHPKRFRLIDIKLRQIKKPHTYLVRITNEANKENSRVLILLAGRKKY